MAILDPTTARRFWSFVGKTESCWLWLGGTARGYGIFKIGDHATPAQIKAHRVAWMIANSSSVPAGHYVCHRCDVRLCVNPAHLFIGTQQDNMRDCSTKGRLAYGERSGQAKLSDAQVAEMRRQRANGRRLKDIATDFGISTNHTWRILARKSRCQETRRTVIDSKLTVAVGRLAVADGSDYPDPAGSHGL